MTFGEIAVSSFAVLVLTGALMAICLTPSMSEVVYHGSYHELDGVRMSQAYESTLRLSFDVPGGLLIRQIHQWAALTFVAAVSLRLLRMFFTGAFRRPYGLNWLIRVGLFLLGMAEGVTGTVLPDDMLSGGSIGLIQGVTQSVPLIGTRLMFLLFGGDVPGNQLIPRFFWLHMVVLPLVMAVLLVLDRRLQQRVDRRLAHRRATAQDQATEAASAVAMFFATSGVLALLGTLAQVSPIWLYGPSQSGATTSGAVPDWYMGFLDGAIRIMPGWEIDVAGHPLTLAVLVPALIVPGAFFTLLAAWPVIERRLIGDRKLHLAPDSPRDAVTRTAAGAAGIAFYGLLWAAAANDQIALHFRLSLYDVTWFFRVAVFAGPVLAYWLTRRICLGLADREREQVEHGHETGRIVMDTNGGFHEITVPLHDLHDGEQWGRALVG